MNFRNMNLRDEFLPIAERCEWQPSPIERGLDPSAEAFIGRTDSPHVVFTVASFDIERQGFPPGSRGFDGAVVIMSEGCIVRLPRELVESIYEIAKKKAGA